MIDWTYSYTEPRFNTSVIISNINNKYNTFYRDYIRSSATENVKDFYKTVVSIIKYLREYERVHFIDSLIAHHSLSLEETLILQKIKNELI